MRLRPASHSTAHARRLAVLGGGAGLVFSASDWVVDAATTGTGPGPPSRADGRVATKHD